MESWQQRPLLAPQRPFPLHKFNEIGIVSHPIQRTHSSKTIIYSIFKNNKAMASSLLGAAGFALTLVVEPASAAELPLMMGSSSLPLYEPPNALSLPTWAIHVSSVVEWSQNEKGQNASPFGQRQLLYYRDEFGDRGENVTIDSSLVFENPRLRNAYIALQAWKEAILSDPQNLTGNWVGSDVCHYTRVYCAQALDNRSIKTVAGIDLNHGDIAGYLPEEHGTVPHKFKNLKLLYELDLSNNRFAGKSPLVVLKLPVLKFLDLRFNEFEGNVPNKLFDKDLDAIFINHNRFQFELPDNFGNSPVSVIVVANNKFRGCVPASLGNMSRTLNEIILMENGLRSCLPPEIGLLKELTVFDVSFNELMGSLPETIAGMVKVEQLNVAHDMLSGSAPASICKLPRLDNFTFSYNFFTGEAPVCLSLPGFDDRRNCLPSRPAQRSLAQCRRFLSKPAVDFSVFRCKPFVPSPVVTTTSLCPATTIAQSYHYPPQNTTFIPSTTTTPQSASSISAYKPTTTAATTTTFAPLSLFILFWNCENPVKSPYYINTTSYYCDNGFNSSSLKGYSYVVAGQVRVWDVADSCTVQTIAIYVNKALEYGFEVSWGSITAKVAKNGLPF
ncbi:unnamed protein product [Camellia sinensis]